MLRRGGEFMNKEVQKKICNIIYAIISIMLFVTAFVSYGNFSNVYGEKAFGQGIVGVIFFGLPYVAVFFISTVAFLIMKKKMNS